MKKNIQTKIFEWEIPKNHPNFTGDDDLPDAYRVFEDEKCSGGIMIEALYHREWEPNPSNTRPLIRHLLKTIISMRNKKKSRPDEMLREEEFKAFYKAYPKKVARGQAEKAWNKLERKKILPSLDVLLKALSAQKKSIDWIKNDGKYIPHPSTWLNGKRWEDEVKERKSAKWTAD